MHVEQRAFTLPCGQALQIAQLLFRFLWGHLLHSVQLFFSLPCGQGLHCAQSLFTLPWGQGVHTAQADFCLPCGHRFAPIAPGRTVVTVPDLLFVPNGEQRFRSENAQRVVSRSWEDRDTSSPHASSRRSRLTKPPRLWTVLRNLDRVALPLIARGDLRSRKSGKRVY